ncbi:MAG TPA: RodZ domain-containing protein [Paracoccaceae bacterium]|nr:RodZ domain-containing protein [Paracoccaceae bacterium]
MIESRNNHQSQWHEVRLGDELRGERATLGKSLLDVQRDLRIRAEYLAAIENCDASAFPQPGFVAGYVRSYARYLGLDPDAVFARFCAESGFAGASPSQPMRPLVASRPGETLTGGTIGVGFPLAEPRGFALPDIPLGAIGSILVLLALIGGLCYGGWTILQNIQRVQFAPVEEVPLALAEVEPIEAPETAAEPDLPNLAAPVASTSLAELYRQQELEVPILVPRDGPIATIDPDRTGILARADTAVSEPEIPGSLPDITDAMISAVSEMTTEPQPNEPQVVAEETRPVVSVIAERPAWIRIYFASGTVIFERILESGEAYEVPDTAEAPMIWAGNSGSVYLRVGDTLRGPIGQGTRASRDVSLDPEAIAERFDIVSDVPSVIAETMQPQTRLEDTIVQ